MFIKLTRFNDAPIWLNASFIVTVEPRNGGGSIVVPIGDGLDYDVKESPATVLALLESAPVPAVVPVPVPNKAALPTPILTEDSHDNEVQKDEVDQIVKKIRAPKAKTKKAIKAENKANEEKALAAKAIHAEATILQGAGAAAAADGAAAEAGANADGAGESGSSESGASEDGGGDYGAAADGAGAAIDETEGDGAKNATGAGASDPLDVFANAVESVRAGGGGAPKAGARKAEFGARGAAHLDKSQFSSDKEVKPMAISEDDFERLRKLSPKTLRKLRNTVKAQLKASGDDIDAIIAGLITRGAISVDKMTVTWFTD